MKNSLNINRLGAAFFIMLLLVMGSSCKDEKADYINLSANSFTFSSNAKEELQINVDASQNWSVTYTEDWVIEKEKTGQSITLGAMPTQSGSVRSTKVIFRAGQATEVVEVSQLGTNVTFNQLDLNSVSTVMSPGGKYVAGVATTIVGNNYEHTPFIINTVTGVKTTKPKLSKAYVASAISDEGLLIISEEAIFTSKYYNELDELTDIKLPVGYDQPKVEAVSSDGKVFVGFVHKKDDNRNYPTKWTNGEPQLLEMPEKTLLGALLDVGAYARGCSADGSIIYGAIGDDQTALYWKEDGKVHFVGEDMIRKHTITTNTTGYEETYQVADRPIFYADNTSISADGKLLATTFLEITVANKAEKGIYYPAYFDIEKNKLICVKDLPDGYEDASGITISNDGILTFSAPSTAFIAGYVYNIHTNTVTRSQDYFREKYGVTLTSNNTVINRFSDDLRTLLGTNMVVQGSVYQFWYLNVND